MSHDLYCQVIGWLFLVTNTGRLLAYFPQILATLRCETGARSVSVLTWSYFALAHFSALLYAVYVLRDGRSAVIFSGNLVVTLVLVAIILWKRRRYRVATALAVMKSRPKPRRAKRLIRSWPQPQSWRP